MSINSLVRIGVPFNSKPETIIFEKGNNEFLFDSYGTRYVDFCGGTWNTPFGYNNEYLNEKIRGQLEKLSYCNLIFNVSDIQENYAKKLTKYVNMSAVIYTCSGSESIEAAIKFARKYQSIKKNDRRGISAFNLSYHGTTYGAMSVSGIDQTIIGEFAPLLNQIYWINVPNDIYNKEKWITEIERHFEKYKSEMAAVIVEPILGSGGIIEIPPDALRIIQELCNKYDILFIDDEVSTGFGRTGTPFMYSELGLKPDVLCLSKGITNGQLPLGATCFSEKVSEVFAEHGETLEHFSTQGGNLLSLAVADGVIDLMENYNQYDVKAKGEAFKRALQQYLPDTMKKLIRGKGLMVGISLEYCKNSEIIINQLIEKLRKNHILVYCFYNQGYNIGLSFFPAYVISKEDLVKYAKKIANVIMKFPELMVNGDK